MRAQLLRTVGRAEERFGEDGLRVLRAARFVATLEFELEAETERGDRRARSTRSGASRPSACATSGCKHARRARSRRAASR